MRFDWLALLAASCAALAIGLVLWPDPEAEAWRPWLRIALCLGLFMIAGAAFQSGRRTRKSRRAPLLTFLLSIGLILSVWSTFLGLETGFEGRAPTSFWAACLAIWLGAWLLTDSILETNSAQVARNALANLAVPAIFGATLLFLWEAFVRGYGVPKVILPAPSAIAIRLANSVPVLAADFLQTFQGIAAGYLIGSGAGLVVAILIDRVPFLQRGLLPLGNLVSALPIVGVAPIMVMWFGFDWPSKAAVVVVMTFFPMLVNVNAGLASAGWMERDLMKTYGARYGQTMMKLRLPSALPFIFNGLKINTTLAFIGAIVAEFFGTPIVGMGFRINTEVGRMNIDMVWATIAVAAIAGSLFYGLVALIERNVTFWHPSYRQRPI